MSDRSDPAECPAATPRTERAIGLLSIAILVLILLGHRAWKLPSTLGRALPNVDIEGEQLTHHLAESDAHVEPSQPATTS